MSKIVNTIGDGAKTTFTWLGQPFKTDELKLELEGLRVQYKGLRQEISSSETVLAIAVNDLEAIKAKFDAITLLSTEIVEAVPPLDPDGLEADFNEQKEKLYDPLATAYTIGSAAGLVFFLPPVAVHSIRWLSGGSAFSKAVSGVGKLGKFIKYAKLAGKAAFVLAGVIFLVDTVIKMIAAGKTNEELRSKIAELDKAVEELKAVRAKISVKTDLAKSLLRTALEEAGVTNAADFLIILNEEIMAIAEHAAYIKLVRRMLRMGQTVEQVQPIFQQLDAKAIEAIATRIRIETELVAGKGPEDVDEITGATAFQVAAVQHVLKVRADAVLGYTDDALVRRHKVSDAVADMQIDLAEEGLKNHWAAVLSDADLTAAAEEILIPVEVLNTLRAQVPAKQMLWQYRAAISEADDANDDPEMKLHELPAVVGLLEKVGQKFPHVPADRLSAMADEVNEHSNLLEFTQTIKDEHAVMFRLPLNVIQGSAKLG